MAKKKTYKPAPKVRDMSDVMFDLRQMTAELKDEARHEPHELLLQEAERFYSELQEDLKDAQEKLQEAKDKAEEQDGLLEDLQRKEAVFESLEMYNTLIGELRFHTTNNLDAEILEVFTQLLAEVQPIKLLGLLQPLLKETITEDIKAAKLLG